MIPSAQPPDVVGPGSPLGLAAATCRRCLLAEADTSLLQCGSVAASVETTARSGMNNGVLNIEVDRIGNVTVCRAVGELDVFTVSGFRQAVAEQASSNRLVIDMSQVPFVDSAGLGALIGGIRRAREQGGAVAVVSTRPILTRLLRTTGFDRIVEVTESIADAVTYLHHSDDGSGAPPT